MFSKNFSPDPEMNSLPPDTIVFKVFTTNSATGSNPSLQDWPGQYNFSIRLDQSEKARDPQVIFLFLQ